MSVRGPLKRQFPLAKLEMGPNGGRKGECGVIGLLNPERKWGLPGQGREGSREGQPSLREGDRCSQRNQEVWCSEQEADQQRKRKREGGQHLTRGRSPGIGMVVALGFGP